jgi:excinuclease ABC subunit A
MIDMGPGAGEAGGRIVVAGPPEEVAGHAQSVTAPFLQAALADRQEGASRDAPRDSRPKERGSGGRR